MRYDRQGFDTGVLRSSIVTVVGSGEVAQQLLVYLAALGVGNLRIVDCPLETSKHFFADVGGSIGLSGLVRAIQNINSETNVEVVLHPFSFYLAEGVLVDTTNSENMKLRTFEIARRKGLDYLSCSTESLYGSLIRYNPENKLLSVVCGEDRFVFGGYADISLQNYLLAGIFAPVMADEVRKIIHPLDRDKPLEKRLDYSFFSPKRFFSLRKDGRVLRSRLRKPKALLVGAGGIGSYVAFHLSQAGFDVVIYDGDKVEDHNLNRQIFYQDSVGKFKAEVLARKLDLKGYCSFVDEKLLKSLGYFDIVYSCVDNWDTRKLLSDFSVERRIPLINGAVTAFTCRMEMFVPGLSSCLGCRYDFASLSGVADQRSGCVSIEQSNVVMNNALVGTMMVLESLTALYPQVFPCYHSGHVFQYNSLAEDAHKFVFFPVKDSCLCGGEGCKCHQI